MSSPDVTQSLSIRAEPSALDPHSCRFTLSRAVHPGGPYLFRSAEDASGSPLVERLFALAGVTQVLVAEHTVTVEKDVHQTWQGLAPLVGQVLRTQLAVPGPALAELAPGLAKVRPDTELEALAKALLDREVNPGVASHGGRIHVEGVRERHLYVRLSGGCQGCAASQVTLKQGVETVIRRALPDIEDIIDVTDHGAGAKPFYPRPAL